MISGGSMDGYEDPAVARAHRTRRRVTLAGLGGLLLIASGVGLTLAQLGGNVLPTILAIAGAGSLLAGVVGGAKQIGEAYRRSDSDFDR